MEKLLNSIYFLFNLSTDITNVQDGEYNISLVQCIKGTCFFISKNTFITAHHIFNLEDSFLQNGEQKINKVFLVNCNGHIINDPVILKTFPDKDITLGKSGNAESFLNITVDSENLSKYEGVNVTTYGCQTEKMKNIDAKIEIKNGKINIKSINPIALEERHGIVEMIIDIDKISSIDNKITINNHRVLFTNQTIELGFSGGPLICDKEYSVLGVQSQSDVGVSKKENIDFSKKYSLVSSFKDLNNFINF